MEKLAEHVRARTSRRRRGAGADVIQLFDSWVGALSPADYEEFVAPYSARILAARRRADDPLRHRRRPTLLAAMADAGGDVIGLDWRIPLDDGWARSARARRAGQLDPAAAARRRGSALEAAARDVSRAPAGGPVTSSTSATASCPRRIPDVLGARADAPLVQERTVAPRRAGRLVSAAVVLMAYGSPERLADVPAYYADIRGGRPIAPEHLADLVERYRRLGIEESNPLNAITEETRAALEARARAAGLHRHEALAAAHRRGRRPRGRDRRRRRSSASCSRRTTRGSRSPATGEQLEQALAGRAPSSPSSTAGTTSPGFVALLADRVRGTAAHVVFTAHSLPARILDEGDPYRDQLLETAAAVAEQRGHRATGRSRSRASRRPASRGSGRTSSTTSSSCTSRRRRRRARLPDRLRLRPPRDPLGHRHRGGGEGARARAAARADRDAERRPGVRRTCSRAWCGGRRRYPRLHERGPDRRRGASRGGSSSASSRRGR